jgi:metal transporter CNNM
LPSYSSTLSVRTTVSFIAEQANLPSYTPLSHCLNPYIRLELKELIAMHSRGAPHGGDLKNDTVTIIGATLDLQEKVVRQAMTPIEDVFMLSIDSKLDYETLKKICLTGHSRVPVYDEVEVPIEMLPGQANSIDYSGNKASTTVKRTVRVQKIIGILLVKQCVLLDPNGVFFFLKKGNVKLLK